MSGGRPWSLVAFFVLAYVLAWAGFIAGGVVSVGVGPAGRPLPGLASTFFVLGAFAPAVAAVWLTARHDGSEAVGALLRRLFQWRVAVRWYVFALTFVAAIKLGAALIHRVALGEWPRFGHEPWYLMLAATLSSTLLLGQAGEEIGWRGYALPRLAARLGLARASVLLGLIWAAWHLPIFFIPGTDKTGQSFPLYVLQVTALSVAFAWLYSHTNGSLLLSMLFHAAANNTKDIVPSFFESSTSPFSLSASPTAWITVGLLWLSAAHFLARMPALKPADLGEVSLLAVREG